MLADFAEYQRRLRRGDLARISRPPAD